MIHYGRWVNANLVFTVLHTNESINLANMLLDAEILVHDANLQFIVYLRQQCRVKQALDEYILLIRSFFRYVGVHEFVDQLGIVVQRIVFW